MTSDLEYAGFWVRVGASLIDTLLLGIVTYPILYQIYGAEYFATQSLFSGGWDFLFQYLLPGIACVAFWLYRSATPGKMVLRLQVVDARTGGPLTPGQAVGRYLGYFVSLIPLGLGILWVAFDSKKQGWHDKLAGTVVVRKRSPEPVRFESTSG